MERNIIKDKSYSFSLRIVNLYKYLIYRKKEYVLSKQVLRSGTSVGANVEEAVGGYSEKDFLYKMLVAYREARETKFWINLLIDSGFLEKDISSSLLEECEEICKIIGKIRSTILNKN